MTDIHAGDAVTLSSDAPDRPVELLADPTSTEVAVDLYFAIDGSKTDLRRLLHREAGKLSSPALA
jgi:hypothetical protein